MFLFEIKCLTNLGNISNKAFYLIRIARIIHYAYYLLKSSKLLIFIYLLYYINSKVNVVTT